VGLLLIINIPGEAQTVRGALEETLKRAERAIAAKNFDLASQEYREAIRLAPSAELYEKLGLTRFMALDYASGAEAFQQAIRREPKRWTSQLFLGICLYRTNRFREALPHLERAFELNPQHNETQFWLGNCYLALRNFDQGVQRLRAALDKEPRNEDYLYALTQAYLDAATLLHKRLGLYDPPEKRRQELEEQHQLRSDQFESGGSWEQSVRRLEELEIEYSAMRKDSMPESERLYVLERVYFGLAQLMGRRVWILKPDSYRSHQLLGEAYEGNEDYEQAIREFQEALRLAPNQPGMHYSLGHVYWQMKRFDDAVLEMEKELALNPQHASANYVLGHIYVYRREFDKAAQFLKRTLAAVPDHVEARKQLGKVYSLTNDNQGALRELEAAVRLDPKDSSVRYLLASVYRKLGQAEKAKKELEIFNELYAQEHQHQDTVLITGGEEGKR
jgi:tetratricopeptide (TPR) repeat protein